MLLVHSDRWCSPGLELAEERVGLDDVGAGLPGRRRSVQSRGGAVDLVAQELDISRLVV